MLRTTFFISILAAACVIAALILLLPTPKPVGATSGANTTDPYTQSGNSFAIINASLFHRGKLTPNTDIIVTDGLVEAIGEDLDVSPVPNILDAAGRVLLPGLIDAHTHSWNDALRDALQFGVTTNLDMFTAPIGLQALTAEREQLTETDTAAIYTAGMLATAPSGHGTQFGIPVTTLTRPDEAVSWVDNRLAEGADFIKIVYDPYIDFLPSLDRPTAKALIEAAHARDVLAVAHISTQRSATDLIEDGIDGLVHIFSDVPVTDDFISLALGNNTFIVPTLAVLGSAAGEDLAGAIAADDRVKPWLSSGQEMTISARFPLRLPGFDYTIGRENVRRLHNAGVPILAGSDAPNPGTAHGVSLHHEIELLVDAGMTPLDAINAATAQPAEIFNVQTGGIIAQGGTANMVLLQNDPSKNIQNTREIAHIWRNGYLVDRPRQDEQPEVSEANTVTNSDLGTFEDGLTTPQGFVWTKTDDGFVNGTSIGAVSLVSPGANGSNQALQVEAQVNDGYPFPWAGAFLTISPDFITGWSIEQYAEISFDVRGTPGVYQAIVFNAGSQAIPPTTTFPVTEDWQRITLKLSAFRRLQTDSVAGLSLIAGPTLGNYTFMIDNVEIR